MEFQIGDQNNAAREGYGHVESLPAVLHDPHASFARLIAESRQENLYGNPLVEDFGHVVQHDDAVRMLFQQFKQAHRRQMAVMVVILHAILLQSPADVVGLAGAGPAEKVKARVMPQSNSTHAVPHHREAALQIGQGTAISYR